MSKKPIVKPDSDADAWARFERAVDVVAKSPPQPKVKATNKKAAPKKKNGLQPK